MHAARANVKCVFSCGARSARNAYIHAYSVWFLGSRCEHELCFLEFLLRRMQVILR